MGLIPEKEHITDLQKATKRAITRKKSLQKKQGKEFKHDEDGHFAGVVPERVWKKHKREGK